MAENSSSTMKMTSPARPFYRLAIEWFVSTAPWYMKFKPPIECDIALRPGLKAGPMIKQRPIVND